MRTISIEEQLMIGDALIPYQDSLISVTNSRERVKEEEEDNRNKESFILINLVKCTMSCIYTLIHILYYRVKYSLY